MKRFLSSFKLSSVIIVLILFFTACEKELTTLPSQVDGIFTADEEAVLGKYLALDKIGYILNVTPAKQAKIILGRVLFFDKNLSGDRSVSCGSCHQPEKAFADDVALSRGASGNITARNSIGLASFGSFSDHYGEGEDVVQNSFFWDERAGEITEQMTQTFANPNEMGMKIHEIGQRVNELDYAKVLFKKAFGTQQIDSEKVIDAIAAFVESIESTNALFDQEFGRAHFDIRKDFLLFSAEQNHGKNLFVDNCASCHAFSLSTSIRNEFDNMATIASNGLDKEYSDIGLGEHTMLPENIGVFKIPGLRNVQLTAPYMHDGRFGTLEEVIDFYSNQIQAHPNLDAKLKDGEGNPKVMNFTEADKTALVSFLETLTGITHLEVTKFSDPFKS